MVKQENSKQAQHNKSSSKKNDDYMGGGKKKKNKIITASFIGLLIFSFALWDFSGGFDSGGRNEILIEVDDVAVSRLDFDLEWSVLIRNVTSRLGRAPTSEDIVNLRMREQVVASLTQRAAIEAEANSLGLVVPEDFLAEQLANEPAFRGPDGKFSPDVFSSSIRNAGLSETIYLQRIKEDIRRDQLISTVIAGIPAPPIGLLLTALQQQRDISYFQLPVKTPENLSPTEQEIADTWNSFPELWTRPEFRRIAALDLSLEQLSQREEVSEASAREWFDTYPGSFNQEPQRRISQLVVGDLSEAQELLQKLIAKSTTWKEALDLYGLSSSEADLGLTNPSGVLNAQLRNAVFAEDVQVGEPFLVDTSAGTSIVLVSEIYPGVVAKFEDVKDQVINQVKLDRASQVFIDLQEEIDNNIATGSDLEDIAKEIGEDLVYTPLFDSVGSQPSEKQFSEIKTEVGEEFTATSDALAVLGSEPVQYAFENSLDSASDVPISRNNDNRLTWVKILNVVPKKVIPLEQSKADVIRKWEQDKALSINKEIAEEALKKAENAIDLKSVSDEFNAELDNAIDVSLTSSVSGIPFAALEKIMSARLGETSLALNNQGNGYLLLRVNKINNPEIDEKSDIFTRVSDALKRNYSQELISDYIADLLVRRPPRYNQQLLNTINSEILEAAAPS